MLSRYAVLNNKCAQVFTVVRSVTIRNAPILEARVQGKVKWYDSVKGYGAIERNDNKQELFVHLTNIKGKNPTHKMRTLAEGEAVEFDVIQGIWGLEAVKVTGPARTNVQGSPFGVLYRWQVASLPSEYYTGGPAYTAYGARAGFGGPIAGLNPPAPFPLAPAFCAPGGFAPPPAMMRGVRASAPAGFAGPSFGASGGYGGYRGPTPKPFTETYIITYACEEVYKDVGQLAKVLSVIRNITIPNAPILETGVQGKVRWYDSIKGYGVIERNDNKQDVFVHLTSIKGKNPQHLMRTLAEGETVEFDVVQGRLGLEAVKVTGPGGTNVQGSPLGVFYRRQVASLPPEYYTGVPAENAPWTGTPARAGVGSPMAPMGGFNPPAPRPLAPAAFPAPGGFAPPSVGGFRAPAPAGFSGPAFGVPWYGGYRGPSPVGFGNRAF